MARDTPLHERLGLGPAPARDDRLAFRWIFALLATYAVSMALFYPNSVTNDDEAQYLRQTQLVLEGHSTVLREDPFTGEMEEDLPSTYPLGPALTMAPFVAA